MSNPAKGKHWYNNGEIEKYALECPVGWNRGRLKKIGEAASKRMIENNPMHFMSEEQLKKRAEKIHQYNLNKTEEQIKHKSEAISRANKGKLKGNIPWNKGKKGLQQAWNKGMHGYMSEEQKQLMLEKQYQTKKQNNSFNIFNPEKRYGEYLKNKYGEENIITQYKEERYPYDCDFYIISEDLFIELNLTWTHGGHPFNPNNEEDIYLLERWKEKAKNSDYYKNAIYTWTELDVKKQNIARKNNLNYRVIYNIGDIDE